MTTWESGYYKGNLIVDEVQFGEAETGTPQVVIPFDIEGNKKLVFLYLSDGAIEYTFEKLEMLGWNGSRTEPKFTNTEGIDLSMEVETYEGKQREKWNISRGFQSKPLAADKGRVLDARWRDYQRQKGGGSSRPAPGTRPTPPPSSSGPGRRPTAGPPSRPAPKQEAPYGKNEAWDAFQNAKKPDSLFWECVELVEKERNKLEADFTDDDWKGVVAAANVPF